MTRRRSARKATAISKKATLGKIKTSALDVALQGKNEESNKAVLSTNSQGATLDSSNPEDGLVVDGIQNGKENLDKSNQEEKLSGTQNNSEEQTLQEEQTGEIPVNEQQEVSSYSHTEGAEATQEERNGAGDHIDATDHELIEQAEGHIQIMPEQSSQKNESNLNHQEEKSILILQNYASPLSHTGETSIVQKENSAEKKDVEVNVQVTLAETTTEVDIKETSVIHKQEERGNLTKQDLLITSDDNMEQNLVHDQKMSSQNQQENLAVSDTQAGQETNEDEKDAVNEVDEMETLPSSEETKKVLEVTIDVEEVKEVEGEVVKENEQNIDGQVKETSEDKNKDEASKMVLEKAMDVDEVKEVEGEVAKESKQNIDKQGKETSEDKNKDEASKTVLEKAMDVDEVKEVEGEVVKENEQNIDGQFKETSEDKNKDGASKTVLEKAMDVEEVKEVEGEVVKENEQNIDQQGKETSEDKNKDEASKTVLEKAMDVDEVKEVEVEVVKESEQNIDEQVKETFEDKNKDGASKMVLEKAMDVDEVKEVEVEVVKESEQSKDRKVEETSEDKNKDEDDAVMEVDGVEAEGVEMNETDQKGSEREQNSSEHEQKVSENDEKVLKMQKGLGARTDEAADIQSGIKENTDVKEKKENQSKDKSSFVKKPAELKKYWEAVKGNTSDFTGWTYLLHYVEQKNIIEFYREAFDAFFQHFPYCYGYWKKYTDMERKHGHLERTYKVFERGVKAVPLSCDLWIHYVNFVLADSLKKENMVNKVREIYERAISAAGTDYRSDKLWDYYLKFERQMKKHQEVMTLHDRLLTIPTQLHGHHFDKLKEHVKKHHPKDILSLDEFLELRAEYIRNKNVTSMDEVTVPEDGIEDTSSELPPGLDDGPPGAEEDVPQGEDELPWEEKLKKGQEVKSSKKETDEEENEAIRKKVIERREVIFSRTAEEIKKRQKFEELIRRPYFHAKALEKGQLKNWREYLEFEKVNGSHERVVILFERCLTACALYEEFWLKYAKYMEHFNQEAVSSVYRRACKIHLPKKQSIHLQWAAFEAKRSCYDTAREILVNLEKNNPGLVYVMLERVNLERRQNNYSRVITMYEDFIEKAASASQITFFSSKLAAFYQKVVCDTSKAQQVLQKAINKGGDKEVIYTMLVDLEYQRCPLDEESFAKVFKEILDDNLDPGVKLAFSRRRVEFIRDFGKDAERLYTVQDEHQKLVKLLQGFNKKRTASEDKEETPEAKKAKVENTQAQYTQPVQDTQTTVAGDSHQQAQYNYQTNQHAGQQYQQQQAQLAYQQQQSWNAYQNSYANYQYSQQQYQPPPQQPYQQQPPTHSQQSQQPWGNYGSYY